MLSTAASGEAARAVPVLLARLVLPSVLVPLVVLGPLVALDEEVS